MSAVSIDYYVRLEQGRERHPSTEVLTALAATLRLDHDGHHHLFRLAGFLPDVVDSGDVELVDPDLLQLMQGWPSHPALLLGRTYDVLARNRLAAALWSPFTYSSNLMLNLFLDDAALTFYADWHTAAANTVAGFRMATSGISNDRRVVEICEELTASSPEFVEIWDRNDARGKTAEQKSFFHPEVGELALSMQTFDVRSSPGQQLVVYHAVPHTGAADAIALLGTLAATDDSRIDPAASTATGA